VGHSVPQPPAASLRPPASSRQPDVSMSDFFDKVAALRQSGQPFAVATVVARRPPVSAHLGDRAIIFADGRMEGFVGGACSREIVRKQALAAMRARHACLVSIRPDATEASTSDPEHVIVPMTCVSEGAIDVYVEPHVQPRRLVVAGATPVANALSRTALSLDYQVVRVVQERERRDIDAAATEGVLVETLESLETVLRAGAPENTAAVVASQGHYDEQALEIILRCGASYVGLVASRKRGASVRDYLDARDVPGLDAVRMPAGLDLGARTPPEVALSILAEIVKTRPSASLTYVGQGFRLRERSGGRAVAPTEAGAGAEAVSPEQENVAGPSPAQSMPAEGSHEGLPHIPIAIDPVCHMEVEVATAQHTADVGGTRFYFCCIQCQARFTKEPARYLEPVTGADAR
jgi:xanthine dehydrogenase accessory factor